ncbi:MAG: hypothetical protein ACE5GQ_04820, partial [Nitrospinales bacterium]
MAPVFFRRGYAVNSKAARRFDGNGEESLSIGCFLEVAEFFLKPLVFLFQPVVLGQEVFDFVSE